jgi:hypothetical protein
LVKLKQSDEAEKLFPCFTIRSLSPFKKRGFFYNLQEFHRNTFDLYDIFENSTILKLNNISQFIVKEIHSILHGKCYSLCPLTLLALNETVGLWIKNQQNVEIFIYRPGEEFWLTLARFPLTVGSAKIESKNSDKIVSADIKVLFSQIIF